MNRLTAALAHRLAGVCLLVLACHAAHAEIIQAPGATGYADLADDRLSFHRATVLEAYRTRGLRDPAWDAQAQRFLSAMCDHWAGATTGNLSTLVELGDAALAAGCQDPLVRYCVGRLAWQIKPRGRDTPSTHKGIILDALPGLIERGYPSIHLVHASRLAAGHLVHTVGFGERVDALRQQHDEALVRALSEAKDPGHQRVVLDVYAEAIELREDREYPGLAKAIEANRDIDPWLREMALGEVHHQHAEDRWNAPFPAPPDLEREALLTNARKHLTAAWQLDPSRPESATRMIRVAMLDSDDPVVEMRQWFDRAVTAQFDYMPAYRQMREGLGPSRHGDVDAMWQFALECAATRRYDTPVPWELIQVLRSAHRIAGGFDHWRRWEVYPHVEQVIDGYARRPEQARMRRLHQTILLEAAWACGKWAQARALLDQMAGEYDEVELQRRDVSIQRITSDIYVHTSRWADQIAHAMQLTRQGDLDGALVAFEMLEQVDVEPRQLEHWVAQRAQTLRWRVLFDRGDEVVLLPASSLAGFEPMHGEWQIDQRGRLIGKSAPSGMALALFGRFGEAWEMVGHLEPVSSPRGYQGGGIILGGWDRPAVFGVMFNSLRRQASVGRFVGGLTTDFDAPVSERGSSFRVRFDHGIVNVWLDDVQVIEGRRVEDYQQGGDNRPGVGGLFYGQGHHVAFSRLTLRSLAPIAP